MRLDHLLSKEKKQVRKLVILFSYQEIGNKISGGDAPGGNTRTHPEHDGKDPGGRWYYAGDGMGEQVAAGFMGV